MSHFLEYTMEGESQNAFWMHLYGVCVYIVLWNLAHVYSEILPPGFFMTNRQVYIRLWPMWKHVSFISNIKRVGDLCLFSPYFFCKIIFLQSACAVGYVIQSILSDQNNSNSRLWLLLNAKRMLANPTGRCFSENFWSA